MRRNAARIPGWRPTDSAITCTAPREGRVFAWRLAGSPAARAPSRPGGLARDREAQRTALGIRCLGPEVIRLSSEDAGRRLAGNPWWGVLRPGFGGLQEEQQQSDKDQCGKADSNQDVAVHQREHSGAIAACEGATGQPQKFTRRGRDSGLTQWPQARRSDGLVPWCG